MKYCLITHIADPDGAFPIILSKLVLENVECFSCEQGEVDSLLEQIIQKDYDTIYIVDLNMTEDMAIKINENDDKFFLIFSIFQQILLLLIKALLTLI